MSTHRTVVRATRSDVVCYFVAEQEPRDTILEVLEQPSFSTEEEALDHCRYLDWLEAGHCFYHRTDDSMPDDVLEQLAGDTLPLGVFITEDGRCIDLLPDGTFRYPSGHAFHTFDTLAHALQGLWENHVDEVWDR